jgi:hypothetical protein
MKTMIKKLQRYFWISYRNESQFSITKDLPKGQKFNSSFDANLSRQRIKER